MKLVRGLLLCLLAMSWTLSSPAASTWKTDKTSGCRFEIPDTWQDYSVQWIGACVDGKADGPGVLRSFGHGKLRELYFGRIQRGVLVIGVIETPDGYIAGRFSEGKPLKDEDRNTYISAFREAAAAANSTSEFYRSKGNEASARFYAEKAKSLDNQMD